MLGFRSICVDRERGWKPVDDVQRGMGVRENALVMVVHSQTQSRTRRLYVFVVELCSSRRAVVP